MPPQIFGLAVYHNLTEIKDATQLWQQFQVKLCLQSTPA
jgi:hypothetical protein